LFLFLLQVDSPIANLVQQGTSLSPDATIQYDNDNPNIEEAMLETMQALLELPHPVVAIMPGAETGVELADMLAVRMGTRSNTEELTPARRNKYLMGEQVRSRGVRAARQILAYNLADVEAFFSD
ncbi:unnamed protein product, partial [Choristocarpus tenellus]